MEGDVGLVKGNEKIVSKRWKRIRIETHSQQGWNQVISQRYTAHENIKTDAMAASGIHPSNIPVTKFICSW